MYLYVSIDYHQIFFQRTNKCKIQWSARADSLRPLVRVLLLSSRCQQFDQWLGVMFWIGVTCNLSIIFRGFSPLVSVVKPLSIDLVFILHQLLSSVLKRFDNDKAYFLLECQNKKTCSQSTSCWIFTFIIFYTVCMDKFSLWTKYFCCFENLF